MLLEGKKMKKVTILHNGGGWTTNIGNAFLDMGSMEYLRQASPSGEIYLCSVFNRWISYYARRGVIDWLIHRGVSIPNVLNIQEYSKIDYIVQSGAFLGEDWFNIYGELLMKLVNKGVKFIINGGGMTDKTYKEEKIEETRKYLKKLRPYVFISRDIKSFENFEDLAEYSYNGIDTAFFINDAYKPQQLTTSPYVILNFDKRPEPSIEELGIINEKQIIRVHHSFWHNFSLPKYLRMRKEYYFRENTMISELPYDYLSLYANTDATYSDRVHACVATLSYGKPARLFSKTPRSLLLERIGAGDITKKLVKPNINKIEREKERQVNFLSEIL